MRLILYSKPGCHLCEGLQEKLEQVRSVPLELEMRDITTREEWFQAYQYEVPVLFLERQEPEAAEKAEGKGEDGLSQNSDGSSVSAGLPPQIQNLKSTLVPLPRPSPRASISQLERLLQSYLT